MEILQLAMLRPRIAVLDETDSGLDIDALRVVAEGVNTFSGPDMGVLIITHYQRILHLVEPDFVHVMFDGRIVKEGGPELVTELEDKGYGWIQRGGRGGGVSPGSAEAFPIERVRAAFPALEREVDGKPVAYLDSGASSQRVLASIQAVDRYERRHHSNVHRGSHTLSAEATAAYEGARATVADHIGAGRPPRGRLRPQRDRGDQPRRLRLGRRQRRRRRPHRAHRDGAPLEHRPLAAARRAHRRRDRLGAGHRRGPARPRRRTRRCWSAGRSWSRSPTSRTCSGPRTRSPRSRASRTRPARWCSPTAPRRRRSWRSTSPTLGVDFYALTGHKAYAPTGIGALWARLDLLREMPPFLGGGSMIRKVTKAGTTWADPPARFEAGTPAIAQAIGLAAAFRWLDALGMDAVDRPRARDRRPTRSSASPRCPGCASSALPPRRTRLGPVSFELEGVHAHDVAEILDRHGVAVRAGHHCAQPLMDRLGVAATARASFGVYTTTRRDRPAGRRPLRRPPRVRARLRRPCRATLLTVDEYAVRVHLGARRADAARAAHALRRRRPSVDRRPGRGRRRRRPRRRARRAGRRAAAARPPQPRLRRASPSGSGCRMLQRPRRGARLAVRGDPAVRIAGLEGDRALVARAARRWSSPRWSAPTPSSTPARGRRHAPDAAGAAARQRCAASSPSTCWPATARRCTAPEASAGLERAYERSRRDLPRALLNLPRAAR